MRTLLLCTIVTMFAAAADAKEKKIVVEGTGELAVWSIADPRGITLVEMLEAYSTARGVSVVYDERRFGGADISITSTNLRLQGDAIDMLVANSLDSIRMGLFSRGENQFSMNPLAEAGTLAPTMNEAEFESAKAWQWCTVILALNHTEPNSVRATIQNLVSRQGGSVQPGRSNITITERADRLKELAKAVREMDAAAATEVKGYDLPEGTDVAGAIKSLMSLFANEIGQRELSISNQSGTNRLLVRARAVRHVEVAQAVAAMK